MEKIKPEVGKNKNGEEVYMLKPEELAELVQRAMKAGAVGSAQGAAQQPDIAQEG